ncbi:MAG TPA: ABC transporter substrate-binding protein [Pusillimonas sp.]|uniref:ABC transporter substrate-binding protein n=1 Tax=Pusillimonas sp. TaxID=3040095 RepID=UPI002CE19AFC|nr:ABC transporter substrate-binding protein [Pusillimonas sp.]HUH87241.1 ABC transporter substrate-binding protein [Pusillimonas sp.]
MKIHSFSKRGTLPRLTSVALLCLGAATAAHADITVGVILSTTGPAASLGQPAENTIKLWPDSIAGQKLRVIVLNDNSDPTEASRQASKLINEEKVDVIVGSSVTPPSIAIVETAGNSATPVIALGGGNAIIEPQEGARTWAFKMPAPERLAVERTLEHMAANGVKTAGAIAVTTSYGNGFLNAFTEQAKGHGIEVTGVERYGAQDLGVTAQTIRLIGSKPDAIYILSFGTPAYLPHTELIKRGYKGKIYQTHGVANADFLRVGGKDVEGSYLAVAPVLVAEQLPDDDPTKQAGVDYVTKYEGQYGAGTRSLFGSTAWTALNWLQATVPVALKQAEPGTPEFRKALRDALEGMEEVVSPEGVFNMTKEDHNGIDSRGQVMVTIEEGKWKLAK